ncbi:hypothetical protein E4T47_08021 [Aureobasidium subglaciale]|nr:hypothetical protein E4T47_08021 [Aureobasidium subglaciale]
MTISKTTEIQTVPITDTQRDGSPVRRSERLADLQPGLDVRTQTQEQNGVRIEKRVLFRTANNKRLRDYAVRALDNNLDNLWPGKLIKVVDSYSQTDLDVHPDDPFVGYTKIAGAIGAKNRYMIVLWTTANGLVATPLYTLKQAGLSSARTGEHVSVTTDPHWAGSTHWAGMPLLMNVKAGLELGAKCYADICRLHWVNKFERIQDDIGSIDGGEYSKLMDLLEIKEQEQRTAAFAKFDAEGKPEPYKPRNAHTPARGVRHESEKTTRMAKKKFVRVQSALKTL